MRLALALAAFALACGASAPGAESPSRAPAELTMAERCRDAPGAVADALGRALEARVQAAGSSEEAALGLLELTPEQPRGQSLLLEALQKRGLTRADFGLCLEQDAEAYGVFQRRLARHVESARARARGLPELSATPQGCLRLLPLTVSAKDNVGLPIAVAARMVLPCAGRVSERELRCAIAEGNLTHFTACQRGERDPPPSSIESGETSQ
jgi:hypothetical protein